MKIAHIFNEVDTNDNKLFISERCFDLDYIKEIIECFKNKKDYCKSKRLCDDLNDEAKFGLKPIEDGSIIDRYDENKISKALKDFNTERILLINGDFWGIQNFIFKNLSSKNAAKIIRARSAMVQLITKVIANKIESFGAKEVLFGAGKFLLVGGVGLEEKLKNLQQELDNWFIDNYFGLAGIVISWVEVNKKDLETQNCNIRKKLKELANKNETQKLNKFNEVLQEKAVLSNPKSEDLELCDFCKLREGKEEIFDKKCCEICKNEIELGRVLADKDYKYLSLKELDGKKIKVMNKKVCFLTNVKENEDVFDITNGKMGKLPKWPLKAYVPVKEEKEIKTFEDIQEGVPGLMALKADIDGLGNTFRKFYFDSFKKFNRLSREVNFFFANYVVNLIEKKYENIYVVFAGGDDLFVIGPYDEIVKFAVDVRDKFVSFALKKATISMGLVMFKHTTPIHFVSNWADEAEKRAKNLDGKDAIDIFGITMKFDEFKKINNLVENIFKDTNPSKSMIYKVIELIEMACKVDEDVTKTEWISKFFYYTNRNIKNKEKFLELVPLIEKYKEKVLPSIYLQLYKLREDKNGKS